MSYKHMEGFYSFSNFAKTNLNLGSSLKEVDWGGNIDPNYTSSECMLMEVDWGGKLIANSMVYWGTHGTHPNGQNTFAVD